MVKFLKTTKFNLKLTATFVIHEYWVWSNHSNLRLNWDIFSSLLFGCRHLFNWRRVWIFVIRTLVLNLNVNAQDSFALIRILDINCNFELIDSCVFLLNWCSLGWWLALSIFGLFFLFFGRRNYLSRVCVGSEFWLTHFPCALETVSCVLNVESSLAVKESFFELASETPTVSLLQRSVSSQDAFDDLSGIVVSTSEVNLVESCGLVFFESSKELVAVKALEETITMSLVQMKLPLVETVDLSSLLGIIFQDSSAMHFTL